MIESDEPAAQELTHLFLQLCLRGRWETAALQMAAELVRVRKLDWLYFYHTLQSEGLSPLIYQIVKGKTLVPLAIEQKLNQSYYQNACRNTLLLHELSQVLKELSRQGVSVLVLKGAALAELVYEDIALRPMSDLDLLIHPCELTIARQTLSGLGYSPLIVEMQAGYTEEFRNEESFVKAGPTNVCIDLHWRLFSPLYYQRTLVIDWFWQTAIATQINRSPALILGREAQIIYLCAHLFLHHEGQGILWQHDIAEVLRRDRSELNWEEVLIQSQGFNLVLPLQKILPLVAEKWCISIPTWVLHKLEELHPSREEIEIFQWFNLKHFRVTLRHFLADLTDTSDWRQRQRLIWNTVFPTRAYMKCRYGISQPILLPFYYFYRLLRGFKGNSKSTSNT